jgi:hypothetical protein
MVKFENKEGFKNITEVRNFLHGLNNRKYSKVYVNVKVVDGISYLCVWLDNNLTSKEINGDEAYLKSINGFKEHYQLKMNKVSCEDESYTEAVQDITTIAWPEISAFHEEEGCDSREIFVMFRGWAKEFERLWAEMEEDKDYYEEVEKFTEKKVAEYKEAHS